MFLFLAIGCEKDKISEIEESIEEKNVLDKGVSLQELTKMQGLEIIAPNHYSETGKPAVTEISMEELAPHLDLSETYLLEGEEGKVLMAPVRTHGTYARNLVSIRKKGVNLDFTMTYPEPSNRNLFFITDLKGRYVLKIEVDAKGNGHTTIIQIPEMESESFIPCGEMVYISCSSGDHSFSDPKHVMECDYWTNSSGTPPQKFKVVGPCGASQPGGGGGGGVPKTPLPNNPAPWSGGGGSSDEGAEVPAGGTQAPPFVHIDCIENLDCEDCNIPGDTNNNCALEPSELFLNKLDAPDRSWYLNNPDKAQQITAFLEDNYYSVESMAFAEIAIEALDNDGIDDGEVDWEEVIIKDQNFVNNTCLNGVYNDLDVSDIATDYLSNFQGQTPVAHLKFTVGVDSAYPTANAVTYPPNNFVIEIMFNPNNLARPRTSVARTFMHEIIHAEMFRKLLSLAQQGSIPWSEAFIISIKDDFPGLSDYYLRWYYNTPVGQQPSYTQHEIMAQHYRNTISDFLMQFDSSLTQSQADALAWMGLKNTEAWNSLTPQEQNNIQQTVNSFKANNPNC